MMYGFYSRERRSVGGYKDTSIRSLYESCLSQPWPGAMSPQDHALAWVEAVNAKAVWAVVISWFDALQDGSIVQRLPDPLWRSRRGHLVTQEIADTLVQEMDEDFDLEKGRFPAGADSGPALSRMLPAQRLAFAQHYFTVLLTRDELLTEAARALAAGEIPSDILGQSEPPPAV